MMPRFSLVLMVCLLRLLAAQLAAHAAEVAAPGGMLVGGKAFVGRLENWSDAGELRFGGNQPVTVDVSELQRWGEFPDARRGKQILLADHSLIVGLPISIDSKQVRLTSGKLGLIKFPLEQVAAILIQVPSDPEGRDALLAKIDEIPPGSDTLLLANGDQLAVTVTELSSRNVLKCETEQGAKEYDLQSLVAVVFNRELQVDLREGVRVLLGLEDGTRLWVQEAHSDGDALRFKRWDEWSAAVPITAVCGVQPLGKVRYVSQDEPISYKYLPFSQVEWPLGKDENCQGGKLRVGQRVMIKGVGMHAPARATYLLPGQFRYLRAELAIDDAAGERGSVVYKVYVPDGEGWKNLYTSPVVRGGEPPIPLSIELNGAEQVSLAVETADRGDELDLADWLHLRVE